MSPLLLGIQFLVLLSASVLYVFGDGSLQSGSLKMSWETTATTVQFNLSSEVGSGWAGVGLSPTAAHTNMWVAVGWINSAGSGVLAEGISNSQIQPVPVQTSLVTSYSISRRSGKLEMSVTRSLNGISVGQSVLLSYAYAAQPGTGTNYPKHDTRGSTFLDLRSKCSAPPVLKNPDALLYENCMILDSIYQIRFRWSVVGGNSVNMQVEGKTNPRTGHVGVGIRRSNFQSFLFSHPNMNENNLDFVDMWVAGITASGGICPSGCVQDGRLKNEATTIDSVNNLQNSQVQYNNSNGIIRGRFSRALAASDTSNDVPIILGNTYYLMYSCHPTEALRASQIPKHFDDVNSCRGQLTINFSSKTTCSDDYSPGVCDSTVIDIPVNVNGSNGNITEQYIQGDENYKVSWKFLLNEIQFDFDCKTRGWAAIGFDKGSRIHQNTDTYIAWILSSGTGVIQDGFSNAQSQPLSDPSQNAIVLSASQEGQNFKLSFKRPLKGPELQDIEISDSSLLVGWAYHPTNNPNSNSIDVPLIQHTARGSTRRNLFTGVGEKYVKPVSPALYYIYAILCVFGIYALIRWLYKFYKLICRSREQRNEDSQLNSSSYFVGSQKVPYSPSAASTTFGSQRGLKSPSGFGSVKLKSQSAFDLIEPDLKSSSLLPKKPHYAFVNAVYGMVHARIFGTHISVMDILIETLIFSINAFFLILYSPSRGFSQVEAWGYLCTANSLLVALPATRNSVLVWILGVPFDKAILHHRWLGRIVVIEATVHFALSIDKTLTNSKYLWGLGAFISLAFILLTSVSYLRRKLFNVFFYSHHAFFAFYILASLHSREFQTYAIAAGIIYVLDRMVRMAWGIYPQKATSVEALPGNVVKIRFPKSCAGRYDVGQYVFLNFPQLNMLEWHPFTLSSGPHEAEAEVSIKGLGNFTGKLREWKAENPNSTLWVRCDGPYGSWPFNYARYPSILLACGGVGVTPCIAVLRHIYGIRSTKSHYEPILKNVHFVWSCKTDEDFLWFKTEILQAMEKSGKHFPKLHLHIHITGSRHASHAMLKIGRPEFEPIFDQIKEETPRAFVVACGPSSMVNEVWDLSVNKSMSKVRFDFHHETFEF